MDSLSNSNNELRGKVNDKFLSSSRNSFYVDCTCFHNSSSNVLIIHYWNRATASNVSIHSEACT